jgi:hypothetical protein
MADDDVREGVKANTVPRFKKYADGRVAVRFPSMPTEVAFTPHQAAIFVRMVLGGDMTFTEGGIEGIELHNMLRDELVEAIQRQFEAFPSVAGDRTVARLAATAAARWFQPSPADPVPSVLMHKARRGSVIEAWIKLHCDDWERTDGKQEAWTALDNLLDDYRLHADCDVPLDQKVEGADIGG